MKIPMLAPRRAFQFRLGTLLLAVVWVALVCMGLRTGSEPWSAILFILATGSMLLAALTSIYRAGRTRAFALGFLIFGGSYAVMCSGEHNYDDPSTAQPDLLTTHWSISLYSLLHGDGVQTSALTITAPLAAPYPTSQIVTPAASYQVVSEQVTIAPAPAPPASPAGMTIPSPPTPLSTQPPVMTQPLRIVTRTIQTQTVSLRRFLAVAHNSLMMLLGLVGGITAQWLYATRRDDASTPPETSPLR